MTSRHHDETAKPLVSETQRETRLRDEVVFLYRDDTCAVCGESLPPDHFYCREHAAGVDDRLHEIGALLPEVTQGAGRLATLLGQVAEETWDYLAEQEPDDPAWPPVTQLALTADAEAIDVDVDSEPGFVRLQLRLPLAQLVATVARALAVSDVERVAAASTAAQGANASH